MHRLPKGHGRTHQRAHVVNASRQDVSSGSLTLPCSTSFFPHAPRLPMMKWAGRRQTSVQIQALPLPPLTQ